MPLTVATFNIRYPTPQDGDNAWPRRRPMVAETLRVLEADAVGLQEVTPGQRAELEQDLPEFEFLGRGRNGDGTGEQVCLLLRRGRWSPVDSGEFWLSETPDLPGSVGWDAMFPRSCTWVRAGHLWLFNTHLDHRGEASRVGAARLLLERLPVGQAAVLMGDFNAEESEEPAAILRSRLVDAWRAAHPHRPSQATWHGFDRAAPGQRIDYLWVTPGIRVLGCEILRRRPEGRCPSDHDPVVATLEV